MGIDVEAIFDDLRGHRRLKGRPGRHDESAQPESLAWGQDSSGDDIILENRASHQSSWRRHSGTLNESTNVGVKTVRSRVGVPDCASRPDGNSRQGTRCFTQVRALLMEEIPYFMLD